LILVAVGLAFEVVFTAIGEYRRTRNRRLMGYSYLWMIPIYAAVYPALTVLYGRVGHWPALGRGFFYAVVILAVEYVSGWILRKLTGECPWERGYYGSKWGIHGLIRLDYTPTWMLAGLLYERIYLVLRGLA
jgi:uncharacterized membrane protein